MVGLADNKLADVFSTAKNNVPSGVRTGSWVETQLAVQGRGQHSLA